ncbi:hypothetical protein [Schlesneria sp. DSM 10557]|uniref:hypothetical protein n=1 Tax=Schlesneria sp. DSM 10557 TaxID=3044399 RepID=UPI0035A1BC24
MSYREKWAPIIAKVIADVGTDDIRKLRQALRDAWDYGPREYHPYKIWLDEIRVQLGLKKTFDRHAPKPFVPKPFVVADGQRSLFD